jgi:ferredoxin--NADP+ reductase
VGLIAPGRADLGQDEHFRLYSVADLPEHGEGTVRITIAVRRCTYIDDYSGEEFDGIASNYLCDRQPGDTVTLAGPFGMPFQVPPDPDANLLLIGTGTGIAPFRALVKHIYKERSDWRGKVWLFYGARSGLELLYMNSQRDDFAQYYDQETFDAFRALSPRPHWDAPIDWAASLSDRAADLWSLLGEPDTYVYIAGLEKSLGRLTQVFVDAAGSAEKFERRQAELKAGGRWIELLY